MEEGKKEKKSKIVMFLIRLPIYLLVLVMTVWATAAIYYSNLPGYWLRVTCAVFFAVLAAALVYRVRPFYK